MNKGHNKGFTLIELLVVIAIIGILATIVLASLNSARSKANDAAVKGNLASIAAQAEIVYDGVSPNSYATVCADATITKAYTAAGVAGGGTGVCNAILGAWAAYAPLKTPPTGMAGWCVDSIGNIRASTALGTGTVCP